MTDTTATTNPPLFQTVFGGDWQALPQVMRDHYNVRAGSDDVVIVSGHLDVRVTRVMSVMARLSGMLVPWSGDNVPVRVTFTSSKDGKSLIFHREFFFPGRKVVNFISRMEHIGGNQLVEFMRFGVGWKMAYVWDGGKVILAHRGYVWRLFGVMIPVPLHWIIGRGHAEEVPVSAQEFSMWTHSRHPLFGKMFGYAGRFTIEKLPCDRS